MRKGDWLQTYTGGRFYPFDPRSEDVYLRDVAHALAMQCRYGGHCRDFYSVAEHCVLMAHAAPEALKAWALLHDASEAYLQDMNRSIKKGLPEYKALETPVQRAIYDRFGFNADREPAAAIKAMDLRIVLDERAQNMIPSDDDWTDYSGLEPLGVELKMWSPKQAETEFLHAFQTYCA